MVANGASELFIEVFEERGPMRAAPWACRRFHLVAALEIEMVVEAFVSESACEL